MSDALIVNASPLIFLGNAGRLDLLRKTGASRIIAPQAVIDEVTATQHDDRAARSINDATWIERSAPIDPHPSHRGDGVSQW
jgi:predicted nucleic acid-binding protein